MRSPRRPPREDARARGGPSATGTTAPRARPPPGCKTRQPPGENRSAEPGEVRRRPGVDGSRCGKPQADAGERGRWTPASACCGFRRTRVLSPFVGSGRDSRAREGPIPGCRHTAGGGGGLRPQGMEKRPSTSDGRPHIHSHRTQGEPRGLAHPQSVATWVPSPGPSPTSPGGSRPLCEPRFPPLENRCNRIPSFTIWRGSNEFVFVKCRTGPEPYHRDYSLG